MNEDDSTGPLEFFDQLRTLVIQQGKSSSPERLILNRAAVRLVCQAIGGGHAQLPAVVLLGQPGHVGFIEGCKLYYDPRLDHDTSPVARWVRED
jgi:hypothetical protein